MLASAHLVPFVLAAAAALGLIVAWAQLAALWTHLRRPRAVPSRRPAISILKPLCGLDDRLAGNLLTFVDLPYPNYEVLLGVRSASDRAYALAWMAARRWPHRFRLVVQQGEPGLNPKVNQLITLARHAHHEILVISDSNTRVRADYLDDIAAHLEDPSVGLVTHLLAGDGETEHDARLGAVADNLHITGVITPGIVAAKLFAGKDYVIGKSMAMRRDDLRALGGFDSVKNVLAGVGSTDFYEPGSILAVEIKRDHPIARGFTATVPAVWFENGPAFEISDATQATAVATYPATGNPLLSGWLLGAPKLNGKAALVDVKHGRGHVVLYGFRPQYRGQAMATYPLIWSAILE